MWKGIAHHMVRGAGGRCLMSHGFGYGAIAKTGVLGQGLAANNGNCHTITDDANTRGVPETGCAADGVAFVNFRERIESHEEA